MTVHSNFPLQWLQCPKYYAKMKLVLPLFAIHYIFHVLHSLKLDD